MRTHANQLNFPLDAPDHVVTFCKTEARAVRISLEIAERQFGRSQQEVSRLTGWKGKSTCLSEIASESHSRRMPHGKRERFALATGCNLLLQVLARLEDERKLTGRPTDSDLMDQAVQSCISAWGVQPMRMPYPHVERRAAA